MERSGNNSDFVVVGGVAAGPKTAATLARRLPRASITLFQKGKYLSYASCGLPYFASGDISTFADLTKMPYGVTRDEHFFSHAKGFDVRTGAEVVAIDRKDKVVKVKIDGASTLHEHRYGKLILATGSRPATPPFPVDDSPRIQSFTRPADAIAFREMAETGKIGTGIIVGGGYIGCEMAEAMGGLWGIATTVIEKEDHVLSAALDPEMSLLVERQLTSQGIDLRTASCVEKVVDDDQGAAVHLAGGEVITADLVVVCVGVVPETTLASECGLEIGSTGGVVVDNRFRTSDADIYAGGDCVEVTHRITGEKVYTPLGSLANRHGWMIAENLAGNNVVYPGVLGSFLLKVFDINIGCVGLNSTAAERFARRPAAVWATCPDRPDYYPESKTVMLKVVYDEEDGRLLGLQAVGEGDVARRVDICAAFLQHQAPVDDFSFFEQGYAPPFSDGVDPLHHLAGIAAAKRRGTLFANPLDSGQLSGDGVVWVDVREPGEQQDKPLNIPGAISLPLDRIRSELSKVPTDKKIVLLCQRGGRAYQAAIFLQDAGFENVVVLGGGKAMLG